MRLRSLVFAALGAGFVLSATAPAFADRDDWRRHEWREHEWRQHEWREHEWREHHRWDRGYYAPPVVVSPPAYGTYYAPPPAYYAPPPGVSFGIDIR